jgi:fructose-1,6-bisphosphatase/inositol monophosphatase family enzyme
MDMWSQQTLIRQLTHLVAGEVVAEEGLRAELVPGGSGSWSWVVDPIDGTSSYVTGADCYGVQVALCFEGRTVGGWINCPALGWELAACDGSGLLVDGVSAPVGPERIVAAQGDFDESHRAVLRDPAVPAHRGTRSCAVDYAQLAAGWIDALLYRRAYPWDHVPGAYLAGRAGAVVKRWDGSLYRCAEPGEGVLVIAAGAHDHLHALLLPPRPDWSVYCAG